MKNVRSILKKVKVKRPDGSIENLNDYVKTLSSDQIKEDLTKILDITKERIKVTDDRHVLMDFYLVFLSLNIGKDDVIEVDEPRSSE